MADSVQNLSNLRMYLKQKLYNSVCKTVWSVIHLILSALHKTSTKAVFDVAHIAISFIHM